MRSRFEEFDSKGEICSQESTECYGGLARVIQYLNITRSKYKLNFCLYLLAGDIYSGTPYYLHKHDPFVDILTYLNPLIMVSHLS